MAKAAMWVWLAVVAVVSGCSMTPHPPDGDVVFVVPMNLVLPATLYAEQFDRVYPHRVSVITSWDDYSEGWPVEVRWFDNEKFAAETGDERMCDTLVGQTSGRKDSIALCKDRERERMEHVLMHEMCHVFGSPGAADGGHWKSEGGACGHNGSGTLSNDEIEKFKVLWGI